MTRKARIAILAQRAIDARAVACQITLGGPYRPTRGGSRYTVRAEFTFQPWSIYPSRFYRQGAEFDCRRLSGARSAVRELLAALPSGCDRAVLGFYSQGENRLP